MFSILLQSIVLILFCHIPVLKAKDLLRLFRPKPDLPQELNDFLTDVQQHKKDFAFIRSMAKNQRKYEKSLIENHKLFEQDNVENQNNVDPFYEKPRLDNPYQSQRQHNYFSNDINHILGFDTQSYYSDGRYSKFTRSPIRLRRDMEENYLNQHVQFYPNSAIGNIKRSGQKYPYNNKVQDKENNKYHTGYIVGINDEENNKDLKEYRPKKKKREVEINIKSDGKLIKHIQEDQNGPKSIVLNIKSATENLSPTLVESQQIQNNENIGPSNSKRIPSLAASPNKKVGVPLSSVLEHDNKNVDSHKDPQEISNKEEVKFKLNQDNADFNNKLNSETNRLPEPISKNIEQSIDMAQSNMNNNNNFENIEEKSIKFDTNLDVNKQQNEKEFEKIQGLVLENTAVITTDASKVQQNYIKRQSGIKRKRWNENIYYDEVQKPNLNTQNIGGLDYSESNQPVNYLNIPELGQENPLYVGDQDSVKSYQIIEKSTKFILIIPITTTECILDAQVPILPQNNEQISQPKNAEEIGEAVVNEIEKAEEVTGRSDEFDKKEEERQEIIGKNNKIECKDCNNPKAMTHEKLVKKKHHRGHKHNNQINRSEREANGIHKENQDTKKNAKSKKHKNHLDNDALRGRKHLPSLPKYKRKWIRQHQKKRIGRESDYYDLNNNYDSPDNAFDFIPSYNRRNLKSIDYEFDPNLIQDVGNHENDIKQFMEKTKDKTKLGQRKKFKSENDYEDEEVPLTLGTIKNVPIKKTKNQFAFNTGVTTEENDDDYDYADLSSDAEEDDDIGYEEEELKSDDNLDIEQAIGNSNRNDHDDDRFNLKFEKKFLPKINSYGHTTNGKNVDNTDKVFVEASEIIASAHAHGRGSQKMKKKIKKTQGKNTTKSAVKNFSRNERKKRKLLFDEGHNEKQFDQKPLTNDQKQNIFLRNNPEFQRWPRFVQNDNKYHELMRERAQKNQQRYLRNNQQNFNQYYPTENVIAPKAEFKRQETTSVSTSITDAVTTATLNEATSNTPQATNTNTTAENAADVPLDPVKEEGNTALIQAAQDMIQTANSDLFENNTSPEEGASTKFYFSTNADDLTENTQCDITNKDEVNTPCPEESATHSPATLTSLLPLIPETKTQSFNISKDEFLDLNEIVVGSLPKYIASHSLSLARGNVRQGLRRTQFNMNLVIPHYNSTAGAAIILNDMTKLMLKLKYQTICQVLPSNLLNYVKIITKNEMDDPMAKLKEMSEIDFDEHQSNFMFHSGQNEKIQDQAQTLKELLNKYNNLPQECKERAEPVRDYIVSHLAMIEHMTGQKRGFILHGNVTTIIPEAGGNSLESKPKTKKEIISSNFGDTKFSLDSQMMEEGLKNKNAGANEIIEDLGYVRINKREVDDGITDISMSTSPQYGKLANAVMNARNRRQVLSRISQIYGKPKREKDNKQAIMSAENDEKGFESPQVFNF